MPGHLIIGLHEASVRGDRSSPLPCHLRTLVPNGASPPARMAMTPEAPSLGANGSFLTSSPGPSCRCHSSRTAKMLWRCWPQGRGGAHHDAPVVATGAMLVALGAAAACNVVPELEFVDVLAAKAAVVLVAAVGLGKEVAMAAAPRALAAPAPRVMADTQASPLLRALCLAELEGGVVVMVLQSRVWGARMLRSS